jgi:hypothetical protein
MLNDEKIQSESCLLSFISHFCNFMGMSEALRKIYITVKPIEFLPMIMFTIVCMNVLFTITQINNMDFDKKLKALVRKNIKEPFEPNFFISGLLVFLNQFHSSNKEIFFGKQLLI